MKVPKKASPLVRAIDRFLAHKRSLGYRYRQEAWLLPKLLQHVAQSGYRDLNAKCFDGWLSSLQDRHPNTRRVWYQIVQRFCHYRRRSEPDCFVPSADGAAKHQPYITPVIVQPKEIARLIAKASLVPPTSASPLQGPVLRLAIVLLYTCGLRLGELLRLTLGDIEASSTVLRVRESKFRKSRLVPVSVSTTRELQNYLRLRRKTFAVHPSAPLLCNRYGGYLHPYSHPGLQGAINRLFASGGVWNAQDQRPRIHDLRHSFAVQALLRWYRSGADVQSNLPKLALYMGHASIVSSAYYLHWVPALQHLASRRFEERFAHLVKGDAR